MTVAAGVVGVRGGVRIAVCEPARSYRRGIAAALAEAGHLPVEVEDWSRQAAADAEVVLVTVRSAADWQVVREVEAANAEAKVVVLLVDPTPDRHAEALRRGAHGVVAWEAAPETILAVVHAALEGMTLVPTSVAKAFAVSAPPVCDPDWITEEEIQWLRLLAQGATVYQVAETVNYSERALYRLLHGLYGRMRVSNRTEAILQASRWGLLDGPRSP
jgi:DNA-binding NarL/FixJ family response regulator